MRVKRFVTMLILAWAPCVGAVEQVSFATSTNATDPSATAPANLPPRLREKWDKLPPAKRQEFLRSWEQWQKLPPDVRARTQKNYQNFRKLNPEQRAMLKKRFDQFQNMTPEQKKKLLENWDRWNKLSPEEREEIRKKMRHQAKRHGSNGGASSAKPSDPSKSDGPAFRAAPAAADP